MYIALAAIGGFALGGLAVYFAATGPFPLWDRGFRIYAVTSQAAKEAVIRMLSEVGLKPRRQIDTGGIHRVLMSDNQTVITYTEPKVWERMVRPAAGLAPLPVRDPHNAAARAVSSLREDGFEARVLGELDEDVPAGAMVFVHTNAFVGTTLVFRKHFRHMGKIPPKWRSSQTQGAS